MLLNSGDATILMQSGKLTTAIVIGESAPKILISALQKFILEFEVVFDEQIRANIGNLNVYNKTDEIINRFFPFWKIS